MVAIFTGLGAGFTRGSGNLLGGAGQIGSSLLGRGGESVSVNAASGNLLVSHQDEFLVGLGPDVAIARTYNSLGDAGDRDNGDNWQQNTTRRVFGLTGTLNSAGSTVSRLGADGAVVVYGWDAARSAYVTRDGSGAFDRLEMNGSEWVWTDGDSQAKEYYEAAVVAGEYRIRAAADIDGNALTFTYLAGTDLLDKVTTADGAWTQYSWTGNAITQIVTGYTDLATSTAKTLTRVRYGYDGQGRLETVTTDLTPDDNSVSDANTYLVTYTYDGTSNRIASIAQTDGSLLQIAYDGSGRVQTLTQTVAPGDARVTSLSYFSGYTSVTGTDGQVTRLDYDAEGRLTRVTAPPASSGGTAQTVDFSYDADDNLDSVTDGAGKVTSYDYDANGNAALITDATGNIVTRTYDAQNRLITTLTTGADRDGASTAHYSQYVYDAEGHLRFAVNAAGQVTEYRYDTAGQLLRTIQYAEIRMTPPGASTIDLATAEAWVAGIADKSSVRIAENSYDARGNLVLSRAYGIADASGNPLTGEGVTSGHYVYDQAGRLLESWREGENHEAFFYDGMGRLVQSTDRNGGTTTIVFADASTTTTITNAAGFSSVSVYNKAGELVSLTESGANTTAGTASYQYDAAGRLRVVTDATGRKSYVYYDKAGRKVAEANHLGEVTEYRYDAAGRVVATVAYATALSASALTAMGNVASTADFSTLRPSSSASDVWGWTVYDGAGRIIQSIDNLGSTVRYEYDTEGKIAKTTAYYTRLTSSQLTAFKANPPAMLQLPAAHGKDAVARVFYNKAGQQIGTLDGEGYLSETIRDGAGLEIQTTFYAAATNAADRSSGSYGVLKAGITTSSADRITYSVYDGQGLLRYSVNARGGIVGYDYDAAGRLIQTTAYATEVALTDYTYDAVKGAVITSGADRISRTVYDAAGRTAYTVDAEGGVAAFQYDAAGRVIRAVAFDNPYASTVSLSALDSWAANSAQASDAKNRVTRNWYNARGEVVFSLDAENYVSGYAYDAEGRVLSTTRYGGSWVTVSDTTTIAQLAALLVGTPTSTAITVSQTYDNAGRVLTSTDGEGTVTRNTYDALGQLTDVTVAYGHADAATTHYTYDGTGRVLTVTAAFGMAEAATVTYAYDGLGNRSSVTDARGNTTTFTYDRQGRVLTTTNALGGMSTYVYDAFGQVVKLTDPRGKSTYTYYDRLGRLVTTRDAENYVTRTSYNRFGEAVDVRRYATAFTGTAQIGVNPTGNPDSPTTGPSPAVLAAYANAAQLQSDADSAAAALAAEQAALAAALANPLPTLQNKLSQLQAQRATVQAQYDAANWLDKLLVYGPQLTSIDSDIGKVNTNITRVNNGQALNSWGTDLVNGSFNVAALQSQYNSAQAAASQALADAQALEAAEQGGGNFGPYSGTAYTYDRLGRVATKIDAEGYGESYAYNAFGNLVMFRRYPGAITGSSYNQTSFEYDERGSITQTTDAEGWIESYTYDAFGRRASLVSKNQGSEKTAGGTTTYEYYKTGLLKSEILPIYSQSSSTGENLGAITNGYVYDKRGNLVQKIEAQGLAEQRTTTYTYDKLDRRLGSSGTIVSGISINPATKAVSTSSGAPTETLIYDANGNVIKSVDAAGATTVFFYDALNRKTAEINALGTYTTYAYDEAGNVTSIRIYETPVSVPANGGVATSAPAVPSGNKRETTFTYDGLGRMVASSVVLPSGYKTGVWNGTAWTNVTTNSLDTSYQYDYLGNVVKVTDPNGNATFSYYDRLGRKTAQLDAEGYLTAWTYNSENNVLTERRYNTGFTGAPNSSSPPSLLTNSADRLTTYTYDKVGNRLSEARSNVIIHNGSGGTNTVTSTIWYSYNGLGQVLTRTEATGDVFTYIYDQGGRLSEERSPQYASNNGTAVTPKVNYFYNGLGDLTRTVQAAGGDVSSARVTTYTYSTGGRLSSMTNAEGDVRNYFYDIAGRLTLETYSRTTYVSGGSTVTAEEGIGYRFDALGRSLGQGFYKKVSGSWQFQSTNDWSSMEYDAFGDVVRVGVNGAWQQQNQYDLAGRIWASNSGDGIWKYFGYDKNGNQTLLIASAGANLSGKTMAQAFALISGTDVNATYTVYDRRNLAISAVEEGRQLSASGTSALNSGRTYNAFGEVASETNAAGVTTAYTYNTMGKMIRSEGPTVFITLENGAAVWVRPAQDFYYDQSGRLVATRDANGTYGTNGTGTNGATKAANTGNLNRLTLLAGTGYGGGNALATVETHADGGTVTTAYDIYGNARKITQSVGDGTSVITQQGFDKLGRLTQVTNPGGLVDYYAYDVLGQRIAHWNNYLASTNKELTGYDVQGRITYQRAWGGASGDETTISYAWSGTLVTPGLATGSTTFGGWVQTTTYENGKTLVEKNDLFGRLTEKTDLGGNTTVYTYDLAGRLVSALTGAYGNTYIYYNTGQYKQVSSFSRWYNGNTANNVETRGEYTYDVLGRRLTELGTTIKSGTGGGTAITKQASATYDALGRLKTWQDTVPAPDYTVTNEYDAVGNVRRTNSWTRDYWFRYDNMNRVIISKGTLNGTAGATGTTIGVNFAANYDSNEIVYDQIGRRVSVISGYSAPESSYLVWPDPANPYYFVTVPIPASATAIRESYSYDSAGRIDKVRKKYGNTLYYYSGVTGSPVAPDIGTGDIVDDFDYDLMGRMTKSLSNASRIITYNTKNQIQSETRSLVLSTGEVENTTISYNYGSGTNYLLGAARTVTSTVSTTLSGTTTTSTSTTTNDYIWRDGTVQSKITVVNAPQGGPSSTATTDFYYDGVGRLLKTKIADQRPRDVFYTNDENGQVVIRQEQDQLATGDPYETWNRFAGKEMGYLGNIGMSKPEYASYTTGQLPDGSTPFPYSQTSGTAYADFSGGSYVPLNQYNQGRVGGSYTVQTGDTLQSIAQSVWGDANLWYKLAEANGLSGYATLTEGQTIALPTGVVRNAHNSATLKPYDPASMVGSVSPTPADPPQPPKKNNCGMFGQILLAAIAIGISAWLGPEILGFFQGAFGSIVGTSMGLAATGATSSIVSQGVGVVTGIQNNFSWKAVGSAALSSVLTGGASTGNFLVDAARSAVSNLAYQGIASAIGLQDHVNWSGVAAAGVSGGLGGVLGKNLGPLTGSDANLSLGNIASHLGVGAVQTLANAATRSAIEGTSFGDNIRAGLPDVIGQVIGQILGSAATGRGKPKNLLKGTPYDGMASSKVGDEVFVWENSAATIAKTQTHAPVEASLGKIRQSNAQVLGSPVPDGGGADTAGEIIVSATTDRSSTGPSKLTVGPITRNYGNDPFFGDLLQSANLDGYAAWFDAYAVGSGGDLDVTWVSKMLARETGPGGPGSGHAADVLVALGRLGELGSTQAFTIASDFYVRSGMKESSLLIGSLLMSNDFSLNWGEVERNNTSYIGDESSISSSRSNFLTNYRDAVWERQRASYGLWAGGGLGYLSATTEFVSSPLTAALDLGSSYYRGRGGLIAPFDRETTDLTLFVSGTGEMVGLKAFGGRSGSVAAESVSARHIAWSSDLGAINDTVAALGQRALRNSGGDWAKSEALFNRYLSLADSRLAHTGSGYAVELQPAAIAGGERVPSFIWRHRGDAASPLIMDANGAPRLFAYPRSRRLDAGIIDMTAAANQYGLRPVVSGYDITLNAAKPPVGGYYREYFGNIPITDIRLRAGN
ncbi:LysM peptidoglycan-binding domain-containing protein [Altererythrobacter sp. CC-YST694]|uniref:LysM peptidoglycan-binding domain-containing protein n=1 Tax=Altererythrobacter sp. CC-YST694 TaxID=2755038 RepID=UPI001D019A55|nr:LysM peptidoglycan-binding domain-containing protein [Altererythrobacter sp. CC-YST694]MCB5426409.1 LysM peptidoglycan-binding domain-containing protein [Altererythrobacter sp. CC-YST694]